MSQISLDAIELFTTEDNKVSKKDWAYNKATKLLGKDPRSVQELKEELIKAAQKNDNVKKLDEKIDIEPAFDLLRQDDLLFQDRRSVETLLNFYPHKGNSFFARKLERKGIDETTLKQVMLEKKYPPESERALIVAQERIEELRQDDTHTLKSILEAMPTFLSGRGFTEASIEQAMALVENMDSKEVDEDMGLPKNPFR